MKKRESKKLDLNQLKVESFVTTLENPKSIETGAATMMGACKPDTKIFLKSVLCATNIGCK